MFDDQTLVSGRPVPLSRQRLAALVFTVSLLVGLAAGAALGAM